VSIQCLNKFLPFDIPLTPTSACILPSMSLSYPVDFSKYCSLAVSRVAPHAGQILLMPHVMVAPLSKSCTCTSLNNHYNTNVCQFPSLLSNYLASSTSKLHFSNSQNIIFTTKHAHIYFFCHSKPVWCNIMAVIVQRSASLLVVSIPVLPRAAERGCWGANCPGPRGAGGPFFVC
jgi:hypothetical protein